MTTALRTRLERFVALGKAATPGPWKQDHVHPKLVRHDAAEQGVLRGPPVADCDLTHGLGDADAEDRANAAFIAAAPQAAEDIAALLAEVQRLEIALDPRGCAEKKGGPHGT